VVKTMIKNPVTAFLKSNASRGIKIIALSLGVILLSVLPLMLHMLFSAEGATSMPLTILFAVGALVGHIGFIVGLLLLLRDMLGGRK